MSYDRKGDIESCTDPFGKRITDDTVYTEALGAKQLSKRNSILGCQEVE